jgi:Phage integrase, N-terminal SAM-like domain
MSHALVSSPPPASVPLPLFAPTLKADKRVFEFFTTQINNDHTRKAYMNATRRFAHWCETHGIAELAAVEPSHIAAFIKGLQGKLTPPMVKQHLAALRMLFNWLVIGHIIDVNPAHAVRGPKYVVRKGETPLLTAEEARELLNSIPLVRNTGDGGARARRNPRSYPSSGCDRAVTTIWKSTRRIYCRAGIVGDLMGLYSAWWPPRPPNSPATLCGSRMLTA